MDEVATCLVVATIWLIVGIILGWVSLGILVGKRYSRGYDDGFKAAQREESAV